MFVNQISFPISCIVFWDDLQPLGFVLTDHFTYFQEGPESLAKSTDILLKLNDGIVLPAHLQVLVQRSQVFSDMLDEGPLSSASRQNPDHSAASDCSKEDAIKFLSRQRLPFYEWLPGEP